MPSDDDALLAAVLAAPADDLRRLAYADFLDERTDPRGEYLRAEVAAAGGSADARRRMRELRPTLPAAWLAALDQPGVMRAAPVPFPPAWVGVRLPGRPHPEEYVTYSAFGYADLPPLPTKRFDGSFGWLGDDPGPETPLGPIADAGPRLPPAFVRFMTRRALWQRVRSCTDCFFNLPARLAACPHDPDGGTLVRFYSDSQSCCHWYLYLQPGGYHCVVSSGAYLGGNPRYPDEADELPGGPDSPEWYTGVSFAAPSFEAFVYRTWIENEIWYAHFHNETRRPFTADEEAYLAHYRRKAGG